MDTIYYVWRDINETTYSFDSLAQALDVAWALYLEDRTNDTDLERDWRQLHDEFWIKGFVSIIPADRAIEN